MVIINVSRWEPLKLSPLGKRIAYSPLPRRRFQSMWHNQAIRTMNVTGKAKHWCFCCPIRWMSIVQVDVGVNHPKTVDGIPPSVCHTLVSQECFTFSLQPLARGIKLHMQPCQPPALKTRQTQHKPKMAVESPSVVVRLFPVLQRSNCCTPTRRKRWV